MHGNSLHSLELSGSAIGIVRVSCMELDLYANVHQKDIRTKVFGCLMWPKVVTEVHL